MENIIKLDFNSLTRIAGNPFGQKVYAEQVLSRVVWDEENIIEFPDYVTGVSISFIQGLMNDVVSKHGKPYFLQYFKIISPSEKVQNKIEEAIIYGDKDGNI